MSSAKAPAPTKEERELQKKQAEMLDLQRQILEDQQQQQKVLLPFLAEQEGFDVELDENGNIKSISKRPDEIDDMRKSLEKQYLEREQAALRGELPVSPGLERELASQEQTLRDKLRAQLGTGYETSSAGIEALQKQNESAEVLREGARTGQLTLAQQLGLAQSGQTDYTRRSAQDYLSQISQGIPMSFAGAAGQVAQGYQSAQAPYFAQRQLQYQASAANSASQWGFAGAVVGAAGKAAAAYFSDDRLKENSVVISHLPNGIPIRVYDYDGERRLGVFASDVEAVMPEAVSESFGYRMVDYGAL